MLTAAEKAFAKDVPDQAAQENYMQMISEAAQSDEYCNDTVSVIERDYLDAINVQASGAIWINDQEHYFVVEDGNWNGTVLRCWDETGEDFEPYKRTVWALQPIKNLIDDAVSSKRGKFLLAKWDAMLEREEIASIPGKYSYDRYVQPGSKIESYWHDKARSHSFDLVTQDEADETRKLLLTLF